MFKKIVVSLFVCISFHVTAMEQVCYLDKIPSEVQNLIASFLMSDDETEEEFIARTEIKKEEISIKYDKLCPWTDFGAVIKIGEYDHHISSFYMPRCCIESSDVTKIAFIQRLRIKMGLVLGLMVTERETKNILYSTVIDIDRESLCFALSSSGKIVASIQRDWDNRTYSSCYKHPGTYNNILKIQNLETKKSECFKSVCTLEKINSLDFNKQGNCFIIHGSRAETEDTKDVFTYQLFSLKDPSADITMNKIINPEKTLQYYFREKYVCKCITSGS